MLSTVIVVLLVVVFIITFIIPFARKKTEGFAGYNTYMGKYISERKDMITNGNRQYNALGASLDPILPTFAVGPADIDNNVKLTIPQYLQQFNNLTNNANKVLTKSLANPDIAPTTASPTNMGPKPLGIKLQLPPPNDLLIKARQCETELKTRDSCSKLDDPTYSSCGICIDEGTKFNGDSPNTFIGGLLSLVSDRNEAPVDNATGKPIYQPTIGKCPPGMFYVDSASCKKAVNQLNCTEIGNTGGFQGGKTKEGRKIPDVSCAQAPVPDIYLYQPPNEPYDVTLRFLSPFGTGITQAIVTHVRSKRTFKADNDGKPGQEFTLVLRGVKEQDQVDIMIIQEQPHRPNGKPEVFQVLTKSRITNNIFDTIDKNTATELCKRIGTQLATNANISKAHPKGLQSGHCGRYVDSDYSLYSIQSGQKGFGIIGQNPQYTFCDKDMEKRGVGAWCYGYKPTKSVNITIPTYINSFFESFEDRAQPAQGVSLYSEYSDSVSNNPPGLSERGILIQWEMSDSQNRTVSFMPTMTMVGPNNLKTNPSALRLLGPYAKSSLIRGPAWSSKSSMQKNQFWFWSSARTSQTAIFTALVPGYLENPYYEDDLQNAPLGPLITNPSTMELLKTSPCFADGQEAGSYSAACLLTLFEGAGGDASKGTLATENGGLVQLNNYGDLSSISEYLSGLYITATSGKDSNGNVISFDMNTRIAAMNDAAMKMFGFKITNPCEDLVDNADGSVGLTAKPMTNVTADCLQYLWLNNQSDQDRSPYSPASGALFTNTYTSIADRFSGLRYNESTPDRRNKYPFQACQLGGSMAPLKNGEPDRMVIGKLTSMDSLQTVQNFFNGIQKAANYGKDQKAQAIAIDQCYGIKQAKGKGLGYGCTLIMPSSVMPGVTCYVNLGDPTEKTNYLMYASGAAFFGGVQNTPNITFMLTAPNTGQAGCISFKTTDAAPLFLRHSGFRIYAHPNDRSQLFSQDSTWKVMPSLNKDSTMVSFQSVNYPDRYFSQAGSPNEAWLTVFANTVDDANRKSFTIVGVPAVPQPLPPSLPVKDGLVLWLDAKDSSTVGVNGLSVTHWKDKSGSGNDMTKISGTVMYTPDSPLTFQAGGILQTAGKISISPGSHVFVVTQVATVTSAGLGYVFGLTDMHGPGDYSIRFMTPTSLAQWDANDMGQPLYYVNGTPSRYAGTVTVPAGVNTICGVASEGGSTRLSLSTAFMNRFLIGTISEVIVFEQNLSDTQRKSVEGYLACKWGLQSKLPQTHPYATTCANGGTQSSNGCIVPDTIPKGTFSGDWVNGRPSATAVNVDDQCNTVAMFNLPDQNAPYTKMVNSKGDAKYYTGGTNLYDPKKWPTYSSAKGHYFFSGF
jgi:Alpha-L-arabinofuranosidase B (ABFB) domain